MDDEDAIRAGREAQAELRQTQAAFAMMRQGLLDKLFSTSPMAEAEILKLHQMVQVVDTVRDALVATVESGKLSETFLEQAASQTRN